MVKDDDLVVATHGRSFWVLDDLTPLRQVNEQIAQADMNLYQPQTAVRLHYPEEIDTHQAAGTNPPPGAIIDYYFKDSPKGEVTLEIFDAQGKPVRHLSSKEKAGHEQPPEWPDQVEAPKTIPAKAGHEPLRLGPALRRASANAGRFLLWKRTARAARLAG